MQQPLTIFDYDDTLFACTHYETSRCSDTAQDDWQKLELASIRLLNLAKQAGPVFVITNASDNWIRCTTQKLMPELGALLDTVDVVYARSKFEKDHPDDPTAWKYNAMSQVIADCAATHCISFGDSRVYDRDAFWKAVRPGMLAKSIVLHDAPTLEQLQRQLHLIAEQFEFIVTHESDLDLMVNVLW